MADPRAVLLDIDGVLVVSWEALPGAVDAVAQVRDAGHPVRFLTNTTSRTRTGIGAALRTAGFEVADDEVLTATAATAAHLRAAHPGGRCLRFDAGAYVAGLEAATGVDAVVMGKPAPAMFDAALAALDRQAHDAVMVGDDLDSDVRGAQALGIAGVLVRTGKFRPEQLDDGGALPDAVLDSVADLPRWLGVV